MCTLPILCCTPSFPPSSIVVGMKPRSSSSSVLVTITPTFVYASTDAVKEEWALLHRFDGGALPSIALSWESTLDIRPSLCSFPSPSSWIVGRVVVLEWDRACDSTCKMRHHCFCLVHHIASGDPPITVLFFHGSCCTLGVHASSSPRPVIRLAVSEEEGERVTVGAYPATFLSRALSDAVEAATPGVCPPSCGRVDAALSG